jgi:hypothetical protein
MGGRGGFVIFLKGVGADLFGNVELLNRTFFEILTNEI